MNDKKFYKALLKEPYMTSKYGDMKYEMNKPYHIEEGTELEMCENGFHYVDEILFISQWYKKDTYDIFEVIPNGKILHDEGKHKYCSEEITLIRKLSEEEIENMMNELCDKYVNDEDYHVRYEVAKHGRDKDLDVLVNDEDWSVRCEVAKHGRDKDLDVLVNDEDWFIRYEVAKHGRDKDLDVLVNDENWQVRRLVANHGRDKDLDVLVNDEDWRVLCLVVKHGRDKDLDVLVNDEDFDVRYEVAKHGRPQDLDVLVNDENWQVREKALELKENK